MLTREQVRERLRVKPVKVEVEALSGAVFARQITVTERRELRELEAAAEADGGRFESEVWLAMHGIVDESGRPMFQNGDEAFLKNEVGWRAVTDLATAVMRANGIEPDEDEGEPDPVGDAAGN